jgi:hypothetical protein
MKTPLLFHLLLVGPLLIFVLVRESSDPVAVAPPTGVALAVGRRDSGQPQKKIFANPATAPRAFPG